MNAMMLSVLAVSALTFTVCGQGEFVAYNGTALTRIGSLDGPFAGPGIWGQFLAGSNVDALMPVGMALEHRGHGAVGGPGSIIIVPGIPCGAHAFVEFVAWDRNQWGTSLAGVPFDQLGRTDIVPHLLSCLPFAIATPQFTQPAIVPIPEPSVWALAALSGALSCWRVGRRPAREQGSICTPTGAVR